MNPFAPKKLHPAPSYAREFPRFGALDVAVDSRFRDDSWSNDTCPSFRYEFDSGNALKLWVDYKEKHLREVPENGRFMLAFYDSCGEMLHLLTLSEKYALVTCEIEDFFENNPNGELIHTCPECDGSTFDTHDERRPCRFCDGLGYIFDGV